jgi:hypothetical protein
LPLVKRPTISSCSIRALYFFIFLILLSHEDCCLVR